MELIGQRFGHIRVTAVVGQGGMGDVYSGYDEKLERKVAVKVLNADQRLDAEARERLLREARALSRLDHPNICRIYDYIDSGDVDLLILEYIDGETLGEIPPGRMTRQEKLRIAAAIANVLVAAHRAGIVHRDLKPENVMLTKSGEVKVLDFGLARWLQKARAMSSSGKRFAVVGGSARLHAADPDTTITLPPEMHDSSATAAGITLGTPLYMSPEQARGETLTTASDMFSFGLLLQALFTGQDPHPAGLSAREVILRAARGDTTPVQGVHGDISALINRLKQFAPADRRTAVETVERLRHLAEKPQRLARRAAATAVAALVAFGGWRYTVDLQRERAIAVAAQEEAVRRRAQAEDLMEFMLGDLRKKLVPVGRLDILDDVGERALEYVQSLDPKTMSADELTRNAKALNQLGDVRLAQGKTAEALDLFSRSLRLADEAVRREPKNGKALLVHGATHFWIGNGLRVQGKTAQALAHMRAYMKDGDALASLDPRNQEYQLERAYGHSGVAYMLEAESKYGEALQHYQTSLGIKERLASRNPHDADAQADLARAINKVGAVLYKQGDLRGALEHSRKEVAIYRELLAREPKQAQWKQRLAASMAYLGRALRDTGDSAAALALFQEELAIERELAALDPTNVDWQRNVAMTLDWVADAQAERGEHGNVLALYAEAHAKMEDAVRRAPEHTSFVLDALNVSIDYGRVLASSGDPRGVEMLRDAIRRLEPMRDRRARYELARASYHLGEVLHRRDRAAAGEAWAVAETELAPLMAASQDPNELSLWTRVQIRRNHSAGARVSLARLKRTGYATTELEQLCAENGC